MKFQENIKKSGKEKEAINYVKEIKEDLLKNEDSKYYSLILPENEEIIKKTEEVLKKIRRYNYLIVIGIGGSNLGSKAIIEAINGKKQLLTHTKKVLFADTTDSDNIKSILKICEKEKFAVVIISKSGTTTESAANYEIITKKIPRKERKERIIIITDENSALAKHGEKQDYECLYIPKNVGGRYSVFSSAGLLPCGFSNINIKELLRGARDATKTFNKNNPSLRGALDLYENYKQNKKINDLFIFNNDLESLGKWYRQLIGESIGKKQNLKGKEVREGITPTVSIGTTDLHSVGQLYIGGPKDKFTTFISIKNQTNIKIPKNENPLNKELEGLKLQEINNAILKGTMKTYQKNELPYNHNELKQKNEYETGYFMQTKMLEIIILAKLLRINAFDQPSVEEYKKETQRILKKIKKST